MISSQNHQEMSIDLSAGSNSPNPALDGVFGSDNRTRVTDTTSDPWRKVGLITVRFGNNWFGSSGVMIGPHHFLTTAHSIFDSTLADFGGNGGYADEIHLYLGQDGQEKYYGQVGVTYFHTVKGYTADNDGDGIIADADPNEDDGNYDWAVLSLDRNIGNYTGWMGWQWHPSLSWYNDLSVNVTGYPANIVNSDGTVKNNWSGSFAGTDHSAEMYNISGQLNSASTYQIEHHLDASGGNSGGPVWRSEGDSEYVIGLTRASSSTTNYATRLQEYMTDLIDDWKTNDPAPVDRPDLVDYDDWFNTDFAYLSSTSVNPGDNFRIRSVVRNNGTAASGNVTVNFYASTDNDLTNSSGSHYLIGSSNLSSINPFGWQNAIWDNTFPYIPSGSYSVIAYIDPTNSINEFDDSANSNQVFIDRLYVSSYNGFSINSTQWSQSLVNDITVVESDNDIPSHSSTAIEIETVDDSRVPTSDHDDLTYTAADDIIDALAGNDMIHASAGNDSVSGNDGNDTLIGGTGNDTINGGVGNDQLIGVDDSISNPGAGEQDILQGNSGADLYILGNEMTPFYDDNATTVVEGEMGQAIIENFELELDRIQLHGTAEAYELRTVEGSTHIFETTGSVEELIGVIRDRVGLELSDNSNFSFV